MRRRSVESDTPHVSISYIQIAFAYSWLLLGMRSASTCRPTISIFHLAASSVPLPPDLGASACAIHRTEIYMCARESWKRAFDTVPNADRSAFVGAHTDARTRDALCNGCGAAIHCFITWTRPVVVDLTTRSTHSITVNVSSSRRIHTEELALAKKERKTVEHTEKRGKGTGDRRHRHNSANNNNDGEPNARAARVVARASDARALALARSARTPSDLFPDTRHISTIQSSKQIDSERAYKRFYLSNKNKKKNNLNSAFLFHTVNPPNSRNTKQFIIQFRSSFIIRSSYVLFHYFSLSQLIRFPIFGSSVVYRRVNRRSCLFSISFWIESAGDH